MNIIFFTNKQKAMAYELGFYRLKKMYELSEQRLKEVAKRGNENNLKKVMDYEHHDIEYAFLFTLTPEYTKNTIVKKRGLTFEN